MNETSRPSDDLDQAAPAGAKGQRVLSAGHSFHVFVPGVLAKEKLADAEMLNRLLQGLAWEAVVGHPLSGVRK